MGAVDVLAISTAFRDHLDGGGLVHEALRPQPASELSSPGEV
jgi:hypothetical protein